MYRGLKTMSDTFDHELEAFERWDNGERDEPGGNSFFFKDVPDFEEENEQNE